MSQIMKPLIETRLSLVVYKYVPLESAITDDFVRAVLIAYKSYTGRGLEVTSVAQAPFAAYFNEVETDPLVSDGSPRTKRDFIVMLEETLISTRPQEGASVKSSPIGIELIKAMVLAARHSDSDIQINYKSSDERRSVLLTKLDAQAIDRNLGGV
jgi:hypothetical protein